jgi:hypothetical protein
MELKYRGISYSPIAPQVDVTETTEQGTFRGARFTLKQYRASANGQPGNQLRFLGRSYSR